jgi:hypothetical protein
MQAMAGLPDERSADYAAALKRVMASKARMDDAREQMKRRAGPLYERARYLSGILSDAYRAAGSPRRPPGSRFQLSATGELRRLDTPEWQAWSAWVQQREQLRGEHGVTRGVLGRIRRIQAN